MRSLSVRLLLSFLTLILVPTAFAHDVTLTGTNTFAALDGSSSDHDGSANGVFTVSDGNLIVNGVVNCNDDSTVSACAMAFNVSGNMTVNTGGALYAENRSGSGNGGAITLTVGGNLALSGNAIISTASKSSSGSNGGAVTANVSGSVSLASGTTIDSGASNAAGGAILIAAAGVVSVDGNVLSGPSRTFLATRLSGGAALDGGTGNSGGGAITIGSSTFAEPAVLIGSNASIVSQGADAGAGPVTIDGCGIQIRGLVAALSRKDGAANVRIRSGKDVLIDGRDLGASGTRMGRIRADAPTGTAVNKGVDVFAAETIDVYGPGGTAFVITSLPGLHDSKSYGGLIRLISLGDAVNASGNVIDDGHSASGDTGGAVQISAKEDVNLNTAVIRAVGDFSTNNANRGGGSIQVRSYSGDVLWTNGTGDVRPVGSSSGLTPADQGKIALTACGTVNTTGSSFPVNGTATSVFPETHTGVCSPVAPSLPSGVPPLIVCNTPPVANDASVSTYEDNAVTITLSGSDADGDPLTFSIVSGPSNGTLGPIVPTGPTSATVNYTPNLNFNGSDSFVYQANDGNGGTDNATVSITVVAVNDPPSFLAGPSVTVLEDSGPQTYPNWATSISAGPADESGQTVTFTVTAADPSLFSVQPAVSSNGTLTFTPAANTSGSTNITVTAHDNGGTANGGNDTSAPQTSSITITAVNDEPSFTAGGDVTVNEDSGAYSAAWASSISAGPNEGSQSVSFVVTNNNNGLFSVQPAISPSGVLTFTPAADANGFATVTVYLTDNGGTANGGDDTSGSVTFQINVTAVNDAPSFTSGGDVTVLEDSAAYSASWATAISAGPANESGQALTFNITGNSDPSLFATGPSISPSGVLSFTLNPNAFGNALITVTLSDDGGTANGGVDTSAPQSFTIHVTGVNDAPSFTSGGDVTVNEDSGAYSAAWATAISAGPNEGAQTVSFNTSNDNNSLFSVQPSISPTGVLSFTPAPNANGFATVTVTLSDNGGTANGGVDTSGPVTFKITVNAVNDPPVAGNDSWETEGNTELRVDLGPSALPHVADTTPSGKGVADNDSDPVDGDPLTITGVVGCADGTAPYDCAVTGGTVSLNANGSFSFQPAPGAASGSFQYTVTDGTDTATGTVSITIHDSIWYVNGSAPAGGNGTSSSPFNDFTSLNGFGDVDGAGDYIFVHSSNVTGSIDLETSEKLWGQGIGLVIPRNLNGNGFPTTLVAAGARPNVSSTGDTVTATSVTGVEIAGLNLSSATGNGIDVTSSLLGSAASASIYSNEVLSAGQEGIDVNGFSAGGLSVSINNTSVTSDGNGVDVFGGDGTIVFSYSNGTITSVSGNGLVVDKATADTLVINGLSNVTIHGSTAGNGVSITSAVFDANAGTAAYDAVNAGAMTVGASGDPVGGAAVTMSNVSGNLAFGSLSAYGSTTGVTIAGSGLFTGAAGMQVTSGGGTINAAAGAGLSVTNASIGAANLSFTSVSATGGANGIVLNNTGTAGGLKVVGTGTAGSGGTIQNTTGNGISLTSTKAVSLAWMNVQNTAHNGIGGTAVVDFSFANGTVSNTGTAAAGAAKENGIAFNTSVSFTENNISGAVSITGSTISNARRNAIELTNWSGTLSSVTISNNVLTSSTNAAASLGHAIQILTQGSATTTANLTKADLLNNQISNFPSGSGIVVAGGSTASPSAFTLGIPNTGNAITISGNQIAGASTATRMGSNAIQVAANGCNGQANFVITNNGTVGNPLTNFAGLGISHFIAGTVNATAFIDNNVIVANNTAGSSGIATQVDAACGTTDAALSVVTITNNAVSATEGNGIRAIARASNGTLKLQIADNTVGSPTLANRNGIRVDSGSSTGNVSLCLDIANNTSAGSGISKGIGLRKQGTNPAVNSFGVVGMAATSSPGVENYVNSQNPAAGGTELISATSGFSNCSL